MFETAVLAKRTTLLWGVIMGVVALAVLLGTGYVGYFEIFLWVSVCTCRALRRFFGLSPHSSQTEVCQRKQAD